MSGLNYNGKKLISAKGISRELDLSYQTVNSYTDLGLFYVITKRNRRRMYDYRKVVSRFAKIRRWIEEGYTLRLISKKLNGSRNGR